MKVISLPTSIRLEPEDLVLVSQLTPANLIMIKVYEWDHFFLNPDPLVNQEHVAQYTICPECFNKAIAEIQGMYAGWSKINKEQPIKLIGIHNQDPKSLFIQFSLGQRYFVYQRLITIRRETVFEELFGKKDNFRLRPLCSDDEQYLISNLKFMPKAKKAISFYPYNSHGYSLSRRHHALPYSG